MRVNDGIIVMPQNAPSISQGYKPLLNKETPGEQESDHPGIDIVAIIGTPVLAAAKGKIIKAGYDPMFGRVITILHQNPQLKEAYKTSYFHLHKIMVNEDQVVEQGEQIGQLGRSGLLAAFRHLHFELRQRINAKWIPKNPHSFWLNGVGQVTCFEQRKSTAPEEFKIVYPVQCKTSI